MLTLELRHEGVEEPKHSCTYICFNANSFFVESIIWNGSIVEWQNDTVPYKLPWYIVIKSKKQKVHSNYGWPSDYHCWYICLLRKNINVYFIPLCHKYIHFFDTPEYIFQI